MEYNMLEYIKNGNIYNSSAEKTFPELEHFADFCILKYSKRFEAHSETNI